MPRDWYFSKKRGVAQTVPSTKSMGSSVTINSQVVIVTGRDANGDVTECNGTVTVTDGGAGYAKNALYSKTDVSAGTSGLYVNVGTTASCNFDLVSDA